MRTVLNVWHLTENRKAGFLVSSLKTSEPISFYVKWSQFPFKALWCLPLVSLWSPGSSSGPPAPQGWCPPPSLGSPRVPQPCSLGSGPPSLRSTSPGVCQTPGSSACGSPSQCLLSTRPGDGPFLLPLSLPTPHCLPLLSSQHFWLHQLTNKGLSSQDYGFSSGPVWMWKLDHKESQALMKWCFQIVVLEKTLESPLDCKEIKTVHPKENQPWVVIGRTDAEAETPILWPPDMKSWLIAKDSDAWKTEDRRKRVNRGWGGWMASSVQWTWVWANFMR